MSEQIFRAVGGQMITRGYAGVAWNFGWHPDPEGIARVLASLPQPYFADAGRHLLAGASENEDALLYNACKQVTGALLPAKRQSIGCCTSMGWSSAVDHLQCVDIALHGAPEEYRPISHAVFYGLGREVANMLGSGDGCYGGALAKAATEFGTVTNADAHDSGTDDSLAAQYGRRGVPSELKALAKQHLVKTTSLVKTAEEARAALQNGYPIAVCSDQGFAMERDQDGYCRAEGSWSHCLCIIGYRADQKRFCILQSWGPNTPSGPTSLGQPDCSFWADWNVVNRMLGMGDSYAPSSYDGFPARDVSWLV